MEAASYEIEGKQIFSKSKIWQLNRDFYQSNGPQAFSNDIVPYNMTSNSFVGKTYAKLIFGFLRDLAEKGKIYDTVYILELGAGHGRLAFHTIMHLNKLISKSKVNLPPYCYVLSDIVADNISYFEEHHQLRAFINNGLLDVSYFDGIGSTSINLRYAKKSIGPNSLAQPIIAIANYFFDSIPNELFHVKDGVLSHCMVSIHANENPENLNSEELIKALDVQYHFSSEDTVFVENPDINEILQSYKELVSDTYFFFPKDSMLCIDNVRGLSQQGLFLISMDKGFHELADLDNIRKPDIVTHGSMSIWVNYHALGAYCTKKGGTPMFPSSSTFNLELGALFFLDDGQDYLHTHEAYQHAVDDFGPDDYNSLKHLAYSNSATLSVKELIAFFRLSAYDSNIFIKLLPRLKQVSKSVTFNERKRIAETMHHIWHGYFSIGEDYDLAYEIGSIFYDLGFYEEALMYFSHSMNMHGQKPDTFYNIALSYYQLRQDERFYETMKKAKSEFPGYEPFDNLGNLEMS